MESTESGSVDDTLDPTNSETAVEDIVTKYEDSEELSSQNEEDQSGQQVYGYLYRSAGSEDATIYVDSRGFNLNGQSLIVTQNGEGNEIIVLVEDPSVQTLDPTFAHTVLQTDEVSFEESLKEHGTLVVDEHSQGLEFIKPSEEVPEEHEERHVYIQNSGEILNISNENAGSPADIETPLWSVSNSGHLKSDGTEMLFIPNPTVVLAQEETKHRKLMQLACIAHELQSADQKNSSALLGDYAKDPETVSEYESSVQVAQADEEKHLAEEETDDKCLSYSEAEESLNLNSKSAEIDSPDTPIRVIDNTVSVIHSTSSELQSSSTENQTKLSSLPDFSSENNFPNSESELREMLYSNINFHEHLDRNIKQLEECSREKKNQNSAAEVSEDAAEVSERCSAETENLELCNNDSPLIFVEKSYRLVIDNLNDENNADQCLKVDEGSSQNSPVLVIEDESPNSNDSDSNLSLTECSFSNKIDINDGRTELEDKVPKETGSVSDIDDDNVSSTEHSVSVSETESSFLRSKCSSTFSYKATTPPLEKSPVLQDDEHDEPDNNQLPLNESDELKTDEKEIDENSKSNASEFSEMPSDNLDSVLVIAEPVAENLTNPNETEGDFMHKEDSESKSAGDVNNGNIRICTTIDHVDLFNKSEDDVNAFKAVSASSNLNAIEHTSGPCSESVGTVNDKSPNDDDYGGSSSDEMSSLKVSRTYITKKKRTFENKTDIRKKIELFTGEDMHFNDNDSNSPKDSSSSHENNTEPDDHLESDVQSKVSAKRTYFIPREKCLFRKKRFLPPKQVLRSTRLRIRSLSSTILKNGNLEISEGDSKQNCFDSNNSDNLPWGEVLLKTSFQPCTSPNDAPSTSFASQYPKETSTPLLSPEQRRRKLNKYKRDFDRLLNSSSPIATKQPKVRKKHSSRIHSNVIKATKSRYSSSHFSRFSKSNSLPLRTGLPKSSLELSKSSTGKKIQLKGQKPKEAKIQYLYREPSDMQLVHSHPNDNDMYSCSSCNFSSIYVDNLMEHLKYCPNRQPLLGYEVNNMDKRQRIRGEEEITNTINSTLEKIRNDLRSVLMDEGPSFNFPFEDEERDSDGIKKRKKYGYGEDDVVWVKFEGRFWPALVCRMESMCAHVKLISYPEEVKGIKVKHENIRTFDNSKWNLQCLSEAEVLPHNEIFVKAVQSCERFMSKKFLGVHVTGKEFFSVRDGVDFATDNTVSENTLNEDSDLDSDSDNEIMCLEPARKARYEKL